MTYVNLSHLFNSPCPVTITSQRRIQRGNVYRPMVITDDDAWDLITKLLQVDPCKRLGANCAPVGEDCSQLKPIPGDLSEIKSHQFFTRGRKVEENGVDASNFGGELRLDIGTLHSQPALKVPLLKDLCIRACAELVSTFITLRKKYMIFSVRIRYKIDDFFLAP